MSSYVEQFGAFTLNGGSAGPEWLPRLRADAIDRFHALGFPTMKNEGWHFTNVAPIAEREFAPMAPAGTVPADALAPFALEHEYRVVLLNGRVHEGLSDLASLPAGVTLLPLRRALAEVPALLDAHLTRVAPFAEQAFVALNTAFMQDGAVLHVQRGVVLDRPVHVLHLVDARGAGGVSHPRNLVVVDANADVTLVESYAALADGDYFTNAVTEVVLGDGARLRHYRLERESTRAFHVGMSSVRQGRDSTYRSFSFAVGGALARVNIHTQLAGAGAGAIVDGLYMLDGRQHVDHQTRIEHIAPHCTSHEVYKGILDGASHGVFNGQVFVYPEAQKTDGKQENNNLLLSDDARIDTKPQLEIFADDVKCTHGATVGRLDEVSLFYMKSRGIPTARARTLLTYAFAAGVLETVELDALRARLERDVLLRFGGDTEHARELEGEAEDAPVASADGAAGVPASAGSRR
ncbi:MAG TPA: Fe-S cluster assembly protein SufD [Gemmatimonadaceae bacterium]|nr:Fe-S cluster assembly protein SufD [Gemmatimonadaceae bacterium]